MGVRLEVSDCSADGMHVTHSYICEARSPGGTRTHRCESFQYVLTPENETAAARKLRRDKNTSMRRQIHIRLNAEAHHQYCEKELDRKRKQKQQLTMPDAIEQPDVPHKCDVQGCLREAGHIGLCTLQKQRRKEIRAEVLALDRKCTKPRGRARYSEAEEGDLLQLVRRLKPQGLPTIRQYSKYYEGPIGQLGYNWTDVAVKLNDIHGQASTLSPSCQ